MMKITPEKLTEFYTRQLRDWKTAGDNYAALKDIQLRDFEINGCIWHAQFNPKRIISSSAKVDQKSINERPCFLCANNRPSEQQGVTCGKYILLVNPYPVFHHHFTIPSVNHIPQRITGNFRSMIDLAKDLEGYTLIYNGPQCGASAPDHFHFQAIPSGILPIEKYFPKLAVESGTVFSTAVYSWKDCLGHPVTLTGSDPVSLERTFEKLFRSLEKIMTYSDEPMINILGLYHDNHWTVHIFPRKSHRPRQFYETGERQILISPASIDMGGILVIPRADDFVKLTIADIPDIFKQVSADASMIQHLISEITHKL